MREHRGGALRVIKVAEAHGGAAYAYLARLAGLSLRIVLPKQQEIGVVKGPADGDGLALGKVAVDDEVKGHTRRLRRAVEVYKPRFGAGALPQVKLLYGEDLAAEAYGAQVFRSALLEGPEAGHERQRRGYPADGVYLMPVQKIEHPQRGHEKALLHEKRRRAAFYDRQHLLHARVHIQRHLHGKAAVLRRSDYRAQRVGVVYHRTVAGGNALGHTRAAGGKYDIRGVCVYAFCADTGEGFLVYLRREQLCAGDELIPPAELGGKTGGGLVADYGLRLEALQYHAQTVPRHGALKRHIAAAGVHHREERGYGARGLVHEHRDRLPVYPATGKQAAAGL